MPKILMSPTKNAREVVNPPVFSLAEYSKCTDVKFVVNKFGIT